ncbi:MAG: ATP-binding protein [Thermoplasmata archaeon]
MNLPLLILFVETILVYLLVLGIHSIRQRTGLGPFYALLGGLTAIMAWTTDAGIIVEGFGITFMVGSTVFYSSILLGVFVLYVFDGPHSTRIAILTIAGISALTPLVAAILHFQMGLSSDLFISSIPEPSLRINAASVFTTIIDLIFLAMAWEFFGKINVNLNSWIRAYLTLLGVILVDVFLFNTAAFLGTPQYLSIMQGTLVSRLIISLFAFPFLYAYIRFQHRKEGIPIQNRPVLSILRKVERFRKENIHLKEEIQRRKEAEKREEFLHSLLRHDVKNKAQIVLGYLQLIKDYELPDEVKDYIDKAEKTNKEGVDIIQKVRKLRKIGKEKEIDEIRVSSTLDEVLSEYKTQLKKNDIDIEVQTVDCLVKGSPLLKELFSNLVENSIKHSGCDEMKIQSRIDQDEYIITVEDDGKGIPDDIKEKVFEKGYKSEETGGSGLGMFLAKQIVEDYDGDIEVKDSKLGGAKVIVKLKEA